ncbi:MAG: phosphomannomutase/phosphoglucomutase [Acidimicrobiales bacterium]
MSVIFKAYDVRGTYPDQLDESVARAVGSAFADHVAAPSVLIARDMRDSGVALSAAFAEGVRARGVEVVDIGLASTDLLYFASGYLDAPGAMFTASHNPSAYNGIKLCRAGARPIGTDTGLADIEAATVSYLASPATGELAELVKRNVLDEWVDHVHSFVDVGALTRLRIVADTANGMGGYVVPAVFADLPFDVEILYPELDGTFPNHPADPLNPDNIVDLQRLVLETGADVGLAFDGDADRVFLVDERAQPLSGSTTTAMVASVMLERHPGATILYNLICSRAVPEVIDECAGVGVRTRVGHSYIKQVMADTGAVFGGEHSGHYYYRDNYRADSGIITAMVILELLSRQRRPLSEVAAPYVRYASSGEINTRVDDPSAVVAAVTERMRVSGTNVDELDGLTVEHDTWWFNLRPSNTEPLLRLNVEAEDAAACEAHVAEVLALIKEMA